jgi:hypothetical protein
LDVFQKIKYVYEYLKQPPKQKNQSVPKTLEIDKSKSRGFVNGAIQGNPTPCGAGGVLYFSYHIFFSVKLGIGIGMNSWVGMHALLNLLKNAIEKRNILDTSVQGL